MSTADPEFTVDAAREARPCTSLYPDQYRRQVVSDHRPVLADTHPQGRCRGQPQGADW